MVSRSKFFGVFAVLTGIVGSLQACSEAVVVVEEESDGGTITSVDASTDRNAPTKDAGRDSATRPTRAAPTARCPSTRVGTRPRAIAPATRSIRSRRSPATRAPPACR
ncbi:MAG: hypothetical protein IPK71_11815 [Myxococcales bacterium]|nr:hypothetical protein [Myxococcales bacterium]